MSDYSSTAMSTTMLVCKQCNFENEPERVYCHNCGAKLDRSLLPPEATRREDPVVVQERVRKMVNPRRGVGLRGVKHFLISLLASVAIATLVVMARTPGDVPAINRDTVLDAPAITDDMEAQQQLPTPHRLGYTEDQVNAFLTSSIHSKPDEKSSGVKFERVYVHFYEGSCAITTEYDLFGYPLYATTVHTVQIQNGTLQTAPIGGALGRLKVNAKVMKGVEVVFSPVWKVLERDRALLAKMQTINFHPGAVEMITRQAAAGH